jgi:hypothetical protein
MSEITLTTKIQKNDNWLTSDMDGETVMMDIDSGKYYALTEVGTSIWEKIDNPITLAEICDGLKEEYEVSAEQCKEETFTFVEMIHKFKIISVLD